MASGIVLTAKGLNLQPNQISLPDGSLSQASNVIIRRDDVIEPRRGFVLDGDTFGDSSSRLKQLFEYKKRIIRHYGSVLQFEDGLNNDGTRKFSNFSGSYSEVATGTRMKSIESNGNCYFTTADGIKKISAKQGSDLSTGSNYITQSGGVKAIDLDSQLNIVDGNQTGFLPQDSTVAYRSVWAINDANNNLILGAPSQRSEIACPLTSLLIRDLARILGALDDINTTGSMINDGTYVQLLLLPASASAANLRTNVLSLASKIDTDILYANSAGGAPLTISSASITAGVCTVTFSVGTATNYFSIGSKIYLQGFGPAAGLLNTNQVVTAVTGTTITFNTTASGAVTLSSATITSFEYRNITQTAGTNTSSDLLSLVMSSPTTDQDLVVVQSCLDRFISRFAIEPTTVISTALQTKFIAPLDITTTASVILTINIPQEVTSNHFLQVYRSPISQATGTTVLTDLTPNDELQLVYEAYPTAAQISAGQLIFEDITPDAFLGAYLYTNESTGEGALAANDIPPFATDINRFKNVLFYANTKTRNRKVLSLLGVSDMIDDVNASITPTLVVSDGVRSNTYKFIIGTAQVSRITPIADVSDSLNGKYFLINSANNVRQYYVWFKTSGGTETDPALTGKIGIRVELNTNDTATAVGYKTMYTIARYVQDFTVSNPSGVIIQITNVDVGYTASLSAGTSGFTSPTVTVSGRGENATNKEVLLSSDISPAKAVDATARSLVRVINKNASDAVYVYYLSGSQSVPGSMDFESRSLSYPTFYLSTNDSNTGQSFNPDISPVLTLSSITAGTATTNLITTSAPHGLTDGDQVVLSGTQTTPVVDGLWTMSYVSSTTFRINTTITVGDAVAPVGGATRAVDNESSSDEVSPNRIYYSKANEPESVPITHYFDVGASDKTILRIFPLRDSLFVFKEDGLFRVSGEVAPFSLELFDASYNLIVADSLALSNNNIYGWTTQGISSLSESGSTPSVSRPIDVELLKLQTPQFTGFLNSTFGVGYESDNSYLVWTIQNTSDTVATIAYRYSTITNTWTTYDKTNSCGLVNPADDKLYLGAGDINYMEVERKAFDRYDYCDREVALSLPGSSYSGSAVKFASVNNIEVGDVLVQKQTVTVYDYNMLLQRLDLDLGVHDTDYYATLKAQAGDDMRAKLVALAAKLDADTGVNSTDYSSSIANYTGSITSVSVANPSVVTTSSAHNLVTSRYVQISGESASPTVNGNFSVTVTGASTFSIPVNVKSAGTSGTFVTQINDFNDILACYNIIINKLNLDSGVTFSNYDTISSTTVEEAIVLAVDPNSKWVTLNNALPWVVGAMTLYKAIESTFTYSPQTLKDPLGLKHLREATVMFENKAFTSATVSFSTDLLPSFVDISFNGDGNGIFGFNKFGAGVFGGGSNGAPFRTYIPRNCQRCRYIQVKFKHKTARENYSVFGVTLTGEISQSSRAYR